MTTLAWDGRYLVADGQVMSGSEEIITILSGTCHKISLRETGGRWWGERKLLVASGAGREAELRAFQDWVLSEGEGPFPIREGQGLGDFGGLALEMDLRTGRRRMVEWDAHGYSYELSTSRALGSGAMYATAVLEHGGNALEALVIACRLDPLSGGSVHYLDTENWREGVRWVE